MTGNVPLKKTAGRPVAFWITLARSILALTLGLGVNLAAR